MRGVSKRWFGIVAAMWAVAMTVGLLGQTPAGPAAVPAEAKKMKAAFPSRFAPGSRAEVPSSRLTVGSHFCVKIPGELGVSNEMSLMKIF